ncbi:MAG: outer membrane homotrimeric porin [Desulfovibrio sp.]|nr:outer membrane homotrimeric porin [Desulfovibrio sp.]
MKLFSEVKKSCMVVMLAAGMLLGATTGAQAIDFKAKGQWLVGFGLGNARLDSGHGIQKNDLFGATQRVRLQLDAVASENLSGRVWFEIGNQAWGDNRGNKGGALGADGTQAIKVKNAFLDWIVPETDLKLRMGIQNVTLPNAAGGSSVIGSTDVAGITASYQFNDMVGLTAFWYRPANDNFTGSTNQNGDPRYDGHYLDNIDLFGVAVPVTGDGFEVTPWLMYGMLGRNAFRDLGRTADGSLTTTLLSNPGGNFFRGKEDYAYSNMFWGGLPIKVTAFDPLNIEFEFNYGYVEGFGDGKVFNNKTGLWKKADSRREGWLVKALVEYKMDWGVPGIFGWYGSGDNGVSDGSGRMPSIKANGRFTSFMGAAGTDWYDGSISKGAFNEKRTSYAGTWGVGLQIRDMSFLEDLKHTFRVAYWGGTNDPEMVRYFDSSKGWAANDSYDGIYLTRNDGLVEFNLDNSYKIYENLTMNFDLGYIINCMDRETWKRSGSWAYANNNFSKHDAWKAQLTFNYSF